ncbi:hypothetical protein F511_09896 [Dorcoceras hygrometricum]|uniref:Uncharacterized protein n=1 Tax=Dorcoceras hygrometricum TaxID=472368 RepID=A0A2Z7CG05_9LAMI|nr:hypothetical protein F511_09896 [Dorcoceras hygrometricum]
MARFVSQALVRSASPCANHVRRQFAGQRFMSDLPESKELSPAEAEARAVQRIEDAIHSIIIKRSKPDWLHFVPGGSYWVPPRRSSYGIEQIVDKLANTLSDEEYLSLTTLNGWPSSSFYINNDSPTHSSGDEMASTNSSSQEEDEGKGCKN